MKAFYLAHREILQTASGQSADGANLEKVSTLSRFFEPEEIARREPVALTWSCYVRLLLVRNPGAQRFHEAGALRGGSDRRPIAQAPLAQLRETT